MSLDYNAWIGSGGAQVDAASRAVTNWLQIKRESVNITIIRAVGNVDTTIAAQTVRIEMDSIANDERGPGVGSSGKRMGIVFGIQDYPGGNPANTNIQREDRFTVGGVVYRVVDVQVVPGEVQCRVEAIG